MSLTSPYLRIILLDLKKQRFQKSHQVNTFLALSHNLRSSLRSTTFLVERRKQSERAAARCPYTQLARCALRMPATIDWSRIFVTKLSYTLSLTSLHPPESLIVSHCQNFLLHKVLYCPWYCDINQVVILSFDFGRIYCYVKRFRRQNEKRIIKTKKALDAVPEDLYNILSTCFRNQRTSQTGRYFGTLHLPAYHCLANNYCIKYSSLNQDKCFRYLE